MGEYCSGKWVTIPKVFLELLFRDWYCNESINIMHAMHVWNFLRQVYVWEFSTTKTLQGQKQKRKCKLSCTKIVANTGIFCQNNGAHWKFWSKFTYSRWAKSFSAKPIYYTFSIGTFGGFFRESISEPDRYSYILVLIRGMIFLNTKKNTGASRKNFVARQISTDNCNQKGACVEVWVIFGICQCCKKFSLAFPQQNKKLQNCTIKRN